MKPSAMVTRGITEATTVGIENCFKKGQLSLSSSVWENKLFYSSASDIMAVKYNTKNANAMNTVKAAAPGPGAAGGGGCVHKVLEAAQFLALVGGLVKVDGYVCQEEAQDKVVNVQV
jgi:hypothetical protein